MCRTVLAAWMVLGLAILVSPCTADDVDRAKNEPAPAAEKADADQADAEQADQENPAEPKPTGKLGIRKGTGRPAGMPAGAFVAPVPQARVEAAVVIDGLVEVPVDDAVALELMRKEKEAELRPLLHAELYFIHLVCDTDRAERQRLLTAAEPELEKVVKVAARRALAPDGNNGVMHAWGEVHVPKPPLEMLRESLLDLVQEHLGQERSDRLRDEMKLRVESQRRVAVGNIIMHLDAPLLLSPQQQEELVPLLLAGWRDEWQAIPQQPHGTYVPEMSLPPAVLTRFTAEQRKRWQAVTRVHFFAGRQLPANRPEEADRWQVALEKLDQAEQSAPAEREAEQSQ